MVEIKITPLPIPPTTKDVASFARRADEFVESLPKFQKELNALGESLEQKTLKFKSELYVKNEELKEELKASTLEAIDSVEQKIKEVRIDELIKAYDEAKNGGIEAIVFETKTSKEELLESKKEIIEEIQAQQENPKDKEWKILSELNDYVMEEITFYQNTQTQKQQIGRKDYFYRNCLPKTHVSLGKMLDISDYLLLWFYAEGIRVDLLNNKFVLPSSGFYSKGTSNMEEVGKFTESGLPDIEGREFNDSNALGSLSGAFYNMGAVGRGYANSSSAPGYNIGFKASVSNPIYGRANDVEVNHISYLEGIYAGQPLEENKINQIKDEVRRLREENLVELGL
ncbi:hypothetical protein [Helicobacter sp. 13S00477-4]|uniref:hypothetical protein n=1 Tax=Helicobacter sp. 13S00477-4 TaxID=1905759 RepID=UPI000BA53311|nr:hypothetical protein [Helicobacter sp. 13S00477-4]PAF51277.1 hypothetical protein BKH44_06110 [Helicobacter sp. 13S00477-4]